MSTHAGWWDNPGQQGDDTPVIRHAPDDGQYHVPDYEQLGKMRGSKVGRFAIIPKANHDGTSRGFDATVAGPVHVDPDAPDGGVVFDPSSVSKRDVNAAISQSYYPHQAFYQLGTPAPLLGYGKKGRFYNDNSQPGFDDSRSQGNGYMPNAYVTPKSAQDGRQMEVPTVIGNGTGGGPVGYNPMFRAQEEQRVNPAPPLNSLGQLPQPQQMAPPAPQPVPQQALPQQQAPPQGYAVQPQLPPGYYPPTYYPPPPPQPPQMDPAIQAMMQAMVGMQQQVAALTQQRNQPVVEQEAPRQSRPPMPKGPPPGLATMPVQHRTQRTRVGQPAYPGEDEFDDETARPIRKQVHRSKKTQEIVDEEELPRQQHEEEDDEEETRRPPRRAGSRRNKNSLIEQDQIERQQTVEEYEEALEREKPRKGVIAGFETLNIPWVTGPVATKAKKQVFFEIPGAGKHSARYHDVIESESCVTLVYDTRYEDGTQYLPPDLNDEQIKLHCPAMKKTFTVSSMGFTCAFGVFDQIILVKHSVEVLDYGDDQ